VKEKGLMQAPSLYSINSNLQMLDNLLKHRLEHDSSFGISYTQWDPNNSSTNTINSILTYVNNFINGSDNLTTHDVVILANVNAWLTDAMKATTASEFKTALNNAKDMLSFKDSVTLDENGEVISGLSEKDGWNSANNAKPNAFYYDSGKDFDERTYSLSQSFDVSFATSSQDLESQLIGEELQKLNFYKKLVIACLENGWQGNESVNDKEYLNATLANTKWLISGVAAKDSSRIFEVKNEELREEALSEYEAKHELISQKAERVDLQMETLKTEQNAINTEMDSLKRTIDDNIKRVFSANG